MQHIQKIKIPITEIFMSISGEGGTSGEIVSFVRTSGCNLRCNYCDTKYSYDEKNKKTIEEIIKEVKKYNTRKIVLTGGEPLFGKEKRLLPLELAKAGFDIYIETNGAVPLLNKEECGDFREKIHYVVDYKSKSSGMNKFDLLEENIKYLEKGDEIKFVLTKEDDFYDSIEVIKKYSKELSKKEIVLLFGTVFGELKPMDLVELLKENNDFFIKNNLKYKLNMQLHKYIWDPNAVGV